MRRILIKDHVQEIQLIKNRAIIGLVLMFLLIFCLIGRLAYLQLAKNDLYTTLSKKNWLDLVPVEPTRGLIFDRNGVVLAENIPIFSLDVVPDKIDNMAMLLSQITKIIPLTDLEIAQFQKQLKEHRRFDEIPLKMRLTEDEVATFADHQYQFPGVIVKARLMRHYPFGDSFTHVLGYVGRINPQELDEIDVANYSASNYIGKTGIEKFYEDELHGTVGYEQVENDASGEPVRVLNRIKSVPGQNVYLTLDSKLQQAVEKALDGHRGAVVAIQPSTGQILAMVSEPTYDPNIFVTGVSTQDYKTLQDSLDRPLYDRALRGLYPLGSTIKPYYALQGLNTGIIDEHFSIQDPGWFQLKNSDHIFHDHKKYGHGIVNVSKAIITSCDTFFYELASRMGIERMDQILNQFGFGQLSGVDLEDELPGNVATPEWKRRVKGMNWFPGDTINAGIGQGFMQATPLQLAQGVATLANRGVRITPHLLLAQQEPGKAMMSESVTTPYKITLNNNHYWDIVITAMQDVIRSDSGTGYRFGRDAPYTVAAKTGTVQVIRKTNYENDHENQDNWPERLRDHSVFIAFAPVENPQIALAIIVENSNQASVIARKIFDYYLVGPQTLNAPAPTDKTQDTNHDIIEGTPYDVQ